MSQTPPDNNRQKEKTNSSSPEPSKSQKNGSKSGRRQGGGEQAGEKQDTNGQAVVVRYGLMRRVGRFTHNLDPAPQRGTKVVVRTDRGIELGEVIACVSDEEGFGSINCRRLEQFVDSNGPDYPFLQLGEVLRLANHQDIIDARHLDDSAGDELVFCRKQAQELGLEMKLILAEHVLGGERIVFYFTAENRVDYGELVRRLARQYHTRIEMRQVGSRDEARLLGDCERCGRECCCREFLKNLNPVSMRMAKIQKATLDPAKISGRCGRLMCCLRYEDASYEELMKLLPRKNTWVRTPQGVAKVVETQTLTQLVRLVTPSGAQFVVPNDEITERDLPEPSARPRGESAASTPPREKTEPRKGPDADVPAPDDKSPPEQKKQPPSRERGGDDKSARKRRRRKSGKSKGKKRRRRSKRSKQKK